MARKMALPKKIAGFKVPKSLRKSRLLRSLLNSPIGRQVVADALVAGAGAGAAVLLGERKEVGKAAAKGTRKGARGVAIATEAVESAASAMMDVVTDAARSMLPEERKPPKRKPPREGAAVRH
jgi:hypothetical protein